MKTISKLAKKFGISRTALLYYDGAGLLKARQRSRAGYRLYGENDETRLELICMYRKAGIALADIKSILSNKKTGLFVKILEKRLAQIGAEILDLKNQQTMILTLLKNKRSLKMGKINKEKWIAIFREAGLTDAQMENWHKIFEKHSPDGHQEFLEFLGISKEEIKKIRAKFK